MLGGCGAGDGAARGADRRSAGRPCRTGDHDAWRELVDRFSRYVYAIAVQGFKLPEHDAEDVFQEVFTRAYEHLHKLRDDEAIRPWLAQLTRRLCIDRLRAGATEQLDDDVEIADADDTIARLDDSLAVHEASLGAPGQLPGDPRSLLRPGRELPHDRRRPGNPSGTIASRISRCLTKLRVEMEGRNPALLRLELW